ncbi:hypothetical protein [Modicisalibacter sp. MOD 31.J]|uniref:hypothetical protein n=1 Tax=Modicisalibacter sp. MOD 31.J TaxID=2831897 RepID=UPI001CCA68E4|nr:hypothetical protein [Modicisalibacter sp. MOD 31.J]MBZ9574571.1 hypothetical protein [Modicisalibacter sp. MOD 31.J]
MSTWHQNRNRSALAALWQPLPDQYKCVSDKPGQAASCMIFADRAAAERYAERTGGVLIPSSAEAAS